MKGKENFLTLFFSFLILFIFGLLFNACGSSIDMSSVKSAEDIEREKNVTQYKPEPEKTTTKKAEPKPQQTSQETTQKTETKKLENVFEADVPSFLRIAPEIRFKFTGKYKEDKEQGRYTSSNHCVAYTYYDSGNFSNDGWYKDSSGVAEKFVDLLITKYPFKLSWHFVTDRTGSDGIIYGASTFYEETWSLDYTGSKSIKKHWVYDKEINEIYAHIHVSRRDKMINSGIVREYTISISDGLNYEDIGETLAPKMDLQPSGGGDSSFDSNSSSSYEYYPLTPIYNDPIEYPDYNDYAPRQRIVIPHYGGISPDSKGGDYWIDP